MTITNRTLAVLLTAFAFTAPVACAIDTDGLDEVGESCRSDLDCPADLECVPAESPNATRVCMPLLG